jgi:hypothetical protein
VKQVWLNLKIWWNSKREPIGLQDQGSTIKRIKGRGWVLFLMIERLVIVKLGIIFDEGTWRNIS